MSAASWLPSQLADRNRTADALRAAADQMNVLLGIASGLHEQGKEHQSDPYWRAALGESRRLDAEAEALGIDVHDIGAEAKRRRG